MKTTTRSIPNDMLSVEEDGRHILINTHKGWINVHIHREGHYSDGRMFSFAELYDALQALLMAPQPSPPSQDDKEAATAPQGVEKGVL